MEEKPVVKVVCAILEQHNRVLVTQRNREMTQPLLWEFPGGKLEPGEEEVPGLIREIKEELQLDILPLQRLTPVPYTINQKSMELIPYICKYEGGVIQLVEHKAYQWSERHMLKSYDWCPADLPVLEEYLLLHKY
ncbi:(deoxy)nucleoside triphosphate pyrophosphohydrolase [Pontibacter sp. 13R65]|uniref:(deoxy)nucleoside triphosphate pyrophosphohydrolase n=1 Tax=Pontibacter sp. 13R65 TaxID=3127458 RepID=UPI00301CEB8B